MPSSGPSGSHWLVRKINTAANATMLAVIGRRSRVTSAVRIISPMPRKSAPTSVMRLNQMLDAGVSWSGRERNCCFLNTGSPRFANVSAVTGLDFLDDGGGGPPVHESRKQVVYHSQDKQGN